MVGVWHRNLRDLKSFEFNFFRTSLIQPCMKCDMIITVSGDSGTRATRAERELQNDDRGDSGTRAEPNLRNDGRLVII